MSDASRGALASSACEREKFRRTLFNTLNARSSACGTVSHDANLRHAIANRLLVQFNYDGLPRVVEPHVYGSKGGKHEFLGFQVGGVSRSGSLPNWRRFDLSKIAVIQVTTQTFGGPRPTPSGTHSVWDLTYAIVR